MLQVHPDDRISVQEALEHPYLKDFHGQMPEPSCKQVFDFSFERGEDELSDEEVHALMFGEAVLYRPVDNNGSKGSRYDEKNNDSEDEGMLTADEAEGKGYDSEDATMEDG
jgi:mitogen-activated protein kinase 7